MGQSIANDIDIRFGEEDFMLKMLKFSSFAGEILKLIKLKGRFYSVDRTVLRRRYICGDLFR